MDPRPVPGHSRYNDVRFADDGTVTSTTSHFPLLRELKQPLPQTPEGLPLHIIPTEELTRRLLPPYLLAEFDEDLLAAPSEMRATVVEEWACDALGLHDDQVQESYERIAIRKLIRDRWGEQLAESVGYQLMIASRCRSTEME